MIIYGKKNLRRLMDSLIIPGVAVGATQCWILPIYKVEINLSEIHYELEKPVQLVQKVYNYDICDDEKGIIIANTAEEAAELFREYKPNTKYALESDPDWEKRVKIYQDGGAMIGEVTELNGVSKICCTVDW